MDPLVILLLAGLAGMTTAKDNSSYATSENTTLPTADLRFSLNFKLMKNFTSQLANKSSEEFQTLAETIETSFNSIYKAKYAESFIQTVINSFSPGSVVVDAELQFTNSSAVPDTSSVANVLVEAASNNTNFSLPVNTSSIVVTRMPTMPEVNGTAAPNVTVPVTVPNTSDSTVSLVFKLEQTFTPTLANKSSAEFKALAETIETSFNSIYKAKYGESFIGTMVNGFSPGSVVVDAELQFKNASAVPDTSSVANVLVEAASNNSNFSLPVNTSSIAVTRMPTETPTPMPTMPEVNVTAAPNVTVPVTVPNTSDSTVSLVFKLEQTFTPTLANKSSAEFKALAETIETSFNSIYKAKYGESFIGTMVNGFSPGSVVVDAELQFTNSSAVPDTSSVANVLVEAASNNSNFSLPVNTSSIVVTRMPTMPEVNVTAAPNVTVPVTVPNTSDSTVSLVFKLEQSFTPTLANKSSAEFKALAKTIETSFNSIYKAKYGETFIGTVVNGFSPGSVVVDAELQFKSASSVPDTSSVANVLVEAASNNSNFSLPVNTSSIAITRIVTSTESPTSMATMPMTSSEVNVTAAPNVTLSPTAMSPSVNMTFPTPNVTSPSFSTMSKPDNASSPPTPETSAQPVVTTSTPDTSESKVSMEFKLKQTFTPTLANKSSAEFKALAKTIETSFNSIYKAKYGETFIGTVVNGFSPGSVVVDAELQFKNASAVPDTSSVANVLVEAASNNSNFSLPVNTSSIAVTRIVTTESPTTMATMPMTSSEVNVTAAPNVTLSPTAMSPSVNMTFPTPNVTSPSFTTMSKPDNASSPPTPETSAQPVVTTSTPDTSESKVSMKFKLEQTFTPTLANKSSAEFKALAETIKTSLNFIYKAKFGKSFIGTVVNGFSPGSVVVDSELQFRNSSAVPDTSSVANVLVEAASNNSNFSLPVNTSSIVVTDITPSTEAPASTAATSINSANVNVTDPMTVAPNATSSTVVTTDAHDNITTAQVTESTTANVNVTDPMTVAPNATSSTVVTTDAHDNITTAQVTESTSADVNVTDPMTVAPNATTSVSVAPTVVTTPATTDAHDNITTAEVTESTTANVNVTDPMTVAPNATTSMSVAPTVVTTPATTDAHDNITTAEVTESTTADVNVTDPMTVAPNATTSTSVAPTVTTVATTESTATETTAVTESTTTTASTDAPTSTEGTLGLSFSLNRTFSSDLSDSSSDAYQTLAKTVTTELNTIGSAQYGSIYRRSIINSFTEGSVVVNSTLVFSDQDSVPSTTNATSVFSTELSKSSSLNVIDGTVSAHATSGSPRLIMGSLPVFLLTVLAVMLINV